MGVRIGNWLTVEQSKTLLTEPQGGSLRDKRDRAILALLIGCGLRRAELVGLGLEDFQVREEHWVIADLIGKGKHIRTVPVPARRGLNASVIEVTPRYQMTSVSFCVLFNLNSEVGVGFHGEFLPVFVFK